MLVGTGAQASGKLAIVLAATTPSQLPLPDAHLGQRELVGVGAEAHGDVVGLAAGEIVLTGTPVLGGDEAQVGLDAVVEDDRCPTIPRHQHLAHARKRGEARARQGWSGGGDQHIEVADGLSSPSGAAGLLGLDGVGIVEHPGDQGVAQNDGLAQQQAGWRGLLAAVEVAQHALDGQGADSRHPRQQPGAGRQFQVFQRRHPKVLPRESRVARAQTPHLQQRLQPTWQACEEPLVFRAGAGLQNLVDALNGASTQPRHRRQLPQHPQVLQRCSQPFDHAGGVAERPGPVGVAADDGEEVAHLGEDGCDGGVVHAAECGVPMRAAPETHRTPQ